MGNIGPHHVPGQTLGIDCDTNPFFQRVKQRLTRLSCPTQKQHYQHHFQNGHKPAQRRHTCNLRNKTRNTSLRSWNALNTVRGCNSHVPCRSSHLFHNADRSLVEPRTSSSTTIAPHRRGENYRAHLVHPLFISFHIHPESSPPTGRWQCISCALSFFVMGRDSLFGTLLAEVHTAIAMQNGYD